MPLPDPEKEFRKDYDAHKRTRVDNLRRVHEFRKPAPSEKQAMQAELQRLRKRVTQLEAQHVQARQIAAVALGQANRMSQIPTKVMKDTLNSIMHALDAKRPS
jgi:hypothetical protein